MAEVQEVRVFYAVPLPPFVRLFVVSVHLAKPLFRRLCRICSSVVHLFSRSNIAKTVCLLVAFGCFSLELPVYLLELGHVCKLKQKSSFAFNTFFT